MSDYKPGEVVDITITGARLSAAHAQPPSLDHLGILVDERYLRVPLGPSVTVTRRVPAEGMPKPGELWESQFYGRLFVIEDRRNRGVKLTDGQTTYALDDALEYGPLTPIYRDEPTPDAVAPQPATVATQDDEPGTVPIGGVSPGTLVTYDEWNAGAPVRILSVEDAHPVEPIVKVVYEYPEKPGRHGHTRVLADLQVTPVSPEVYL